MSGNKKREIALAILMVWLAARCVFGLEPMTFESGDMQTTLIELFTSEGCSSCPPADAWISQLKDSPELWKKVVPVAFHVDYWDGLGWPDRFAKPEFTARQRQYVATWPADSVYTPEFVVNGREWRDWYGNHALSHEPPTKAGNLRVTLSNETQVTAVFAREDSRTSPVQLHIALLGSNLESDVKRGENSGRKLRPDFVVLQLDKIDMVNGADHWTGSVSFAPNATADKPTAIAAWVTSGGNITPIQATGGWLNSVVR